MVSLSIHDTGGWEDLSDLRLSCYKDTDLFLLCVAVNRRTSLAEVAKFTAEMRDVGCPITLIVTKKDLRD